MLSRRIPAENGKAAIGQRLLADAPAAPAVASTADPSRAPLAFIPYEDVVRRLSPAEGKALHDILDVYPVLDLKASGLGHLQGWFDEINQRLSAAVEKEGRVYVVYRIYLLADEEANAWIYKHQPSGAEHARGHVFLTTGLMAQMLKTLGAEDYDALTSDQSRTLLEGLAGILAHEFAHPKQDELIMWDMRAKQGLPVPSVQFDEAATDWLGLRLLDSAGLPRRALLTGLQLLFGKRPAEHASAAKRAFGSLLSGHPERKLRLSLISGALTDLRINRGLGPMRPTAADADETRADVISLMKRVRRLDEFQLWGSPQLTERSEQAFLAVLDGLKQYLLGRNYDGTQKTIRRYLSALQALNRLLEARERPRLSSKESGAWLGLLRLILPDKMPMLYNHSYLSSAADRSLRLPREPFAVHPLKLVRDRQKALNQMAPRLGEEFADQAVPLVLELLSPQNTLRLGAHTGGFDSLPSLLPRPIFAAAYRALLPRLGEFPPDQQAGLLLEMLQGGILGGGPPELDLEILHTVENLCRSGSPACQIWAANFRMILGSDAFAFNQRLLLFDQAFPDRKGRLLQAYARLTKLFFSDPSADGFREFIRTTFGMNPGGSIGTGGWKRVLAPWLWDVVPESRYQPFWRGNPRDMERMVRELEAIFANAHWQRLAWSHVRPEAAIADEDLLRGLAYFLSSADAPLTLSQRLRLHRLMAAPRPPPGAQADERGLLSYRLQWIDRLKGPLRLEALNELLLDYGRGKLASGLARLERALGADPLETLFKSDGDSLLSWLRSAEKGRLLTRREAALLLDRYFGGPELDNGHRLYGLRKDSALDYWKHRQADAPPEDWLRPRVRAYRVDLYAERLKDLARSGFGGVEGEWDRSRRAGVTIMPSYARLLRPLAGPLAAEFLRSFRGSRDAALSFCRLLFNPDGVPIRMEFKKLVNYTALDDVAARFAPAVPKGLEPGFYWKLWLEMTAKRSNRYTDAFFSDRAEGHLASLAPARRRDALEDLLRHGRLASESLRLLYLEEYLRPEFSRLKAMAAAANGPIPDHEAVSFLEAADYFAPHASRFKDDYLESAAWAFKLDESQLARFIEPGKSYNHRSLNILGLNLLSAMSVLMERLNVREKLALVRYIREPRGGVLDAAPRLGKLIEALAEENPDGAKKLNLDDWISSFDTFARDASQPQRHIFLELLVGMEGSGLMFQGPKALEPLYAMLGMDPASRKQFLFEAYRDSVEPHERSVILSYLLSLSQQPGQSELLNIFEAHRAPGIKAAQMASILSLFGKEHDAELARAKDAALRPSKMEAYRMLKSVYPEAAYRGIRNIHAVLGSASIKVVLLVEFKDGSLSAVNVMRPYTEQTIQATLGLAETFHEKLRQNRRFNAEFGYDYRHYLDVLKRQMILAMDFKREMESTVRLQSLYKGFPPVAGWSFGVVEPTPGKPQTERVMHFTPILNAVKFGELGEADKKAASELILRRELQLLFKFGLFDPDRTVANYLFVPSEKKVYPIDFSEAVRLETRGFLKPDDRYYLAGLLRALTLRDSDPRKLLDLLLALSEGPSRPADRPGLERELKAIIERDLPLHEKLLEILGRLSRSGIHVVPRISLGAAKGLTILMNEEYARHVDQETVRNILTRYVRKQALRGKAIRVLDLFRGARSR